MLATVRTMQRQVTMSTYNCRQVKRGLKFGFASLGIAKLVFEFGFVGLGIAELVIKFVLLLFKGLEGVVGLLQNVPLSI
jgi:hypothetical protein